MKSKIFAVLALLLLLVSASLAAEETIALESTFSHNSPGQYDLMTFSQGYEPTYLSAEIDARYLTFSGSVLFRCEVQWGGYMQFQRHIDFTTPGQYYDSETRTSETPMTTSGTLYNAYSRDNATGTSYVTTKIRRQI